MSCSLCKMEAFVVTLQLFRGFRLTSEQRHFLYHSLTYCPSGTVVLRDPPTSLVVKKTSVFKSTVVTLIPSSPKIFSSEPILSQLWAITSELSQRRSQTRKLLCWSWQHEGWQDGGRDERLRKSIHVCGEGGRGGGSHSRCSV